jgi:hypothetical protein
MVDIVPVIHPADLGVSDLSAIWIHRSWGSMCHSPSQSHRSVTPMWHSAWQFVPSQDWYSVTYSTYFVQLEVGKMHITVIAQAAEVLSNRESVTATQDSEPQPQTRAKGGRSTSRPKDQAWSMEHLQHECAIVLGAAIECLHSTVQN